MSIINHFCITNSYFNFLDHLNIDIIVAGSEFKNLNNFPKNWLKDNCGENISYKNKSYGTLSSHYWLWKNKLNNFSDNEWIGINHHRRFWIKNNEEEINLSNLSKNILREIPQKENFDVLLPKKIIMKNLKFSKILKKGFHNYIRNPAILFNRSKLTIELQFDLFHGYKILYNAAEVMNHDDKKDFIDYIRKENSFHQYQLFVSKKKIIEGLYKKTFPWIKDCEEKFKNISLTGYGKERLYDFLAERFFSFYFEKYAKIKIWPIKFLDFLGRSV